MGRVIAGLVAFLIVAGSIFVLGVIVGGSWSSGMDETAYQLDREAVDACLPAESVDDLEQCLEQS